MGVALRRFHQLAWPANGNHVEAVSSLVSAEPHLVLTLPFRRRAELLGVHDEHVWHRTDTATRAVKARHRGPDTRGGSSTAALLDLVQKVWHRVQELARRRGEQFRSGIRCDTGSLPGIQSAIDDRSRRLASRASHRQLAGDALDECVAASTKATGHRGRKGIPCIKSGFFLRASRRRLTKASRNASVNLRGELRARISVSVAPAHPASARGCQALKVAPGLIQRLPACP